MTNQEAIRILEFMKSEMLLSFDHDRKKALKLAISALEKQIPKKPTIKQDRYNENLYTLYCPTCGSYIGMYNKRLKMSDFSTTQTEIFATGADRLLIVR